jgi:hypothetical protein
VHRLDVGHHAGDLHAGLARQLPPGHQHVVELDVLARRQPDRELQGSGGHRAHDQAERVAGRLAVQVTPAVLLFGHVTPPRSPVSGSSLRPAADTRAGFWAPGPGVNGVGRAQPFIKSSTGSARRLGVNPHASSSWR